MGNPHFYFYPDGQRNLQSIDLGEKITDLQRVPLRMADSAKAGGRMYRTSHAGGLRVRIIWQNFSSDTIAYELKSMSAHLERGGAVGFSVDHAKSWCGLVTSPPPKGRLLLPTGGNIYSAWNSSATLAANDVLVMESPDPRALREYVVHSSTANNQLTLSALTIYTYELAPMVRYHDFYPVLTLPQSELNKAFVTHDHRLTYTLDITLELDLATMFDLTSAVLRGTTVGGPGSGGVSIDGAKGKFRQDLVYPGGFHGETGDFSY